jgi:hypothetical protein
VAVVDRIPVALAVAPGPIPVTGLILALTSDRGASKGTAAASELLALFGFFGFFAGCRLVGDSVPLVASQ